MLSLNAADVPRMPNGLQLSAGTDNSFYAKLRVGMPVLFGAQRLLIEAVDCSLDLSACTEWDAHIERSRVLDRDMLERNGEWLRKYLLSLPPPGGALHVMACFPNKTTCGGQDGDLTHFSDVHAMAQYLCGRGIGLTPAGDDMLAGWMAVNWLLYGPTPAVLEACQQIMLVARRQTHVLSQCWLGYAAEGNVALPIKTLLEAMTKEDDVQLERTTRAVLSMGATSGYDVLQGMLCGLHK